jgi:hypothetical protein
MRRIYSQATPVFISLGPQTELTRPAIKLGSLFMAYQAAVRVKLPCVDALREEYPWADASRMWIVQEVAACKNRAFFCGHQFFEWPLFDTVADFLPFHEFVIPKMVRVSDDSWRLTNHMVLRYAASNVEEDKTLTFADLLIRTDAFEASDERDKLYALLGLASDATQYPPADYTKPFSRVYHDFARALNRAGLRNSSLADLPSWVPNLRTSAFSSFYLRLAPSNNEYLSLESIACYVEGSYEIILVPGGCVGKIVVVAEPFILMKSGVEPFINFCGNDCSDMLCRLCRGREC